MTDKCTVTARDCPITPTFLVEHGEIMARLEANDQKLEQIYRAVTNGNSLTQRMNAVENKQSKIVGGLVLLSVIAPIVTAIAMKLMGE